MYLAIIILPLLGSIVSGFFGRKIGVSGAQIITCTSVIITTFLAIIAFIEVGLNNIPVSIHLFNWIDSESVNILWNFNFDCLTVSMLIPVLTVSSLVHLYSIGYMSHDPHNQRFFSYLSLFTFMMIILVTANNYLLMFVGWEGVGICSYLLVSFWFTRIAANQSSISAMLTNRVGDCLLTVGMFTILWSFGNIDYSTVFSLAPYINENIITIIGICLLIGAMAKSSQIGLHVWLPMAMEGPTPVSALIHAATMVTAGVYLLMRSSPLIEYSSTVLLLCLWVGAITTVFSSLIGLFQQDIKKVIAYSTMSQLGIMVIAVGLSSYNIALFHLVNHAFYKALLFLGAGAVIHAVSDNQDFRKYGGLKQFLPLTYSVMLIASLSLVAFPFMTGFYSKDFILESSYGQFCLSSTAVYFIAVIGAMFTTLYSLKVLYLTFITNPNGPITNYKLAHESNLYMSLPLSILALFSIFYGYITKDMFIGLGSSFFSDNSLFIHPINEIMLNTEFAVPIFYKLLPLLLTILLTILFLIISEFYPSLLISFKFSKFGYNLFSFLNQRFTIELFYNKFITDTILKLGGQTTKFLDKGFIELVGPYGLEKALYTLSVSLSKLDTGLVTTYALYILVGLMFNLTVPYISYNDNLLLPLVLISIFININNIYKQDFVNYSVMQSFIFKNVFNYLIIKLKNIKSKYTMWNIISKLITILACTIWAFALRILLLKYSSMDVFNGLDHPVICFYALFSVQAIRVGIAYILECIKESCGLESKIYLSHGLESKIPSSHFLRTPSPVANTSTPSETENRPPVANTSTPSETENRPPVGTRSIFGVIINRPPVANPRPYTGRIQDAWPSIGRWEIPPSLNYDVINDMYTVSGCPEPPVYDHDRGVPQPFGKNLAGTLEAIRGEEKAPVYGTRGKLDPKSEAFYKSFSNHHRPGDNHTKITKDIIKKLTK